MKKITLFIAALVMSVMSYALNPFAYALSSSLSEDGATLTVSYSLNAEATAVSVVVLDGEEVVKTVPCEGLAAGEYTVEVPTEGLPTGKDLTWKVEVQGTSVEAPTEHATNYSFFHPSSVDIDNNPENPTFGLILTNEAMQSVASKTEGYISAGFGAGIYAFTPAFEPIANGDKPGFNGGKTFSTVKNDYAPRRIRFSKDGRIFATAQDGSGEYLWEINPENLDEWTTVFQGTNDSYTLKDAEGNFIAGTNSGFDVRGEGENLQLLMLSATLPGAQVGSFACHVYDLGTATTWATAPTKEIPGANYMLVTNQSNAQFDKDGGVWYIQHRATTTEAEPGLVHINKDGVEDLKLLRHYTRNAGFRFTPDFSKVIVAGVTSGANERKATVYAVSEDENGVPVLTEELVVNTTTLGSNLNDFAWDYAGNLYAVSNSNELIVAYAMPYSGLVATPAASQYTFQLLSSTPSYDLELPVEISNLTTDLMTVGDLSFLQLNGSNDMEGVEVMLFIPDYTGEDKEYALDLGNYYLTLGGTELTLVEGALTQTTDPEKGATYAGRVVATAEEDGQLMTVALDLTMYSIPPVEIEIEDVTITVDEESAIALFTADWEGTPLSVEVSGFEEADFAEYPECWLTLGDDVNWVDAAAGPVAIFIEDGVAMLEGEFVSYATGQTYYVMLSGNMPVKEEPVVELVGVVKRALQYYDATIVLTHEEDGTAHIYNVVDGVATEVSQEGVIAVDPENAGDLLAISDIALTEDGKLVAVNYMICQSGDDYVDEGYKRGENRFYIWNDLAEAPSVWFTSKMCSNWFRSKQGHTMAVKGTSDNAEILVTGIHATKAWARVSCYKVIDGVFVEPEVNHNDYYNFYDVADAVALETTVGTNYQLTVSPLAPMNWILDAELIDPVEIVEPETNNTEISSCVALSQDLGKKYQGVSIVTVGEQVLMVAPYATEFGVLAGAKVLDITAGLDAAEEVTVAYLDSDIEATAAATAVQVVEGGLVVKLVADGTIYTLNVKLSTSGPEYIPIEEEVTDLMIDTEYLTLAGTGNYYGFEVYLTLGQDNMDGTFALDPENSFVTFGGVDANFIEGYAYDIDLYAPAATAVTRIELDGQYYEVTFYMSNKPVEAIDIVIEDATVAIDTIPMFGDVVEYALRMTANWTNPADGVTYPVLVEVPVYYPEATEPSEIMSTVTVGGWADTDPWLGFGEGYLTVSTTDNVVTATGLVENTWLGFAANITISGKLPQGPTTGLDNLQVEMNAVKTIKNGQLIIVRDGKEFNAQGAVVK